MIMGSTDLFMDFGEWNFRMGRPVANEGFLKALLSYGTFDGYCFFCPDSYHRERFVRRLEELIEDPRVRARIKATLQISLAESIQNEEVDVFHMGDFTSSMPYLVEMRNHYAKTPIPITGVTHSLDGTFMNLRYLQLLLCGLTPCDAIVCTSRAAEAAVEKGFLYIKEGMCRLTDADSDSGALLSRIPLGIDDSFFDNDMNRKEARAFFSMPQDKVIALFVGRLSLRYKTDWAPIFELLARMNARREIDDLLLVIAGGGTNAEIELLRSIIECQGLNEKIIVFPNFPPEVKTRLYRASDLYLSIVDNYQETFGLTIAEAMASSLPVIASDFSGYREFFSHGKEGFLIPTLGVADTPDFLLDNIGPLDSSMEKFYLSQTVAVDLEKLHDAIIHLCGNGKLRKKMGQAAKTRAFRFRWPRIIGEYESLWRYLHQQSFKSPAGNASPRLLSGDPLKTLSHFPARLLKGEDVLRLTDVGRKEGKSGNSAVRYEDIQPLLFQELEELIFGMLLKKPASLSSIQKKASKKLGASEGQVLFHILWLIKHGFIRHYEDSI